MANLRYTARFKRDFRQGVAAGCDPKKLKALLELLRMDAPLPLDSRGGHVKDTEARTCRVEPGWLLIYRAKEGEVTLLRMKYIRRERPTVAPPVKLWFKTLLRSPVKTVLTVLLLTAAAFLLLDNLSSYAMQTEAVREAEEKVEGVLTVERSPVREPAGGSENYFLLTEMGENYARYSYDSVHHTALNETELEALEALPYIDGVDRRYMTAGVSADYGRIDGPYANYGYMDRLVIEATAVSVGPNPGYERGLFTGVRTVTLKDVTLLAGDRRTLDEQLRVLDGVARLNIYPVKETSAYYKNSRVFLGGLSYNVDCLQYDVTWDLLQSVEKGRRYVFVVRAPRYDNVESSSYGFWLGDDSLGGWWPYVTDVTGLGPDYLETEGFAPLRQLIQITNDDIRTFDVVYTDDMASIRRVSRQQLTPVRGRFLEPADEGRAVCVVSEAFLERSGLGVGDEITLRLGNRLMEQYEPLGAVAVTRERYASAWEEQTFTVIGSWKDAGGRRWQEHEYYAFYSTGSWQAQDPYWAYSENAVFVPSSFLPESCDAENHLFRPAEVSFVVRDADSIGAFAEEGLPLVEEMGLSYSWSDANWPIVAEKMAQTRSLTLLKLMIFTVASLLAVGLTLYLFLHRRRKEYAVLRALGTPRRAAARALRLPLLALAALSACLGLLTAWLRSGAAAQRSAAEFAEAGLEAMPKAHFAVYLLGAAGLLLVTGLLAGAYTAYFPTLKSAFENHLAEAMREPTAEEGYRITYIFADGLRVTENLTRIWTGGEGERMPRSVVQWWDVNYTPIREENLYAMSEEQRDALLGLLDSALRSTSYDQTIAGIVHEEAAAYFAGQRSAEEVSQRIQSRAELYLSEQG